MRLPKQNQGISSFSLRFLSPEQADSYDKVQVSKISKIRWQVMIQHLLHCSICSCLFVFSKFDLKIFLMAICSFLCGIFMMIPLRRLRTLYMISLLISRACLIASVLLFFKSSTESYGGITNKDLYFIGGICVFLSISQFQQWVVKILSAGVCVFLFIALFQLGISSYIIGSLAIIYFAVDVYITEKDKREDFLKMEKNRCSLLNWEKFMDANFSDPFFALGPAPTRKRHSSIRVSDSQIDPSSFVARMKIMKYAKSSFNNKNRSGDEENVQVSIVPQGIELRVDHIKSKNNAESPNINSPPDIILEEQPDNNLSSEDFRVEFQNIASQKEFYQKGNQREYLLSELKQIVVSVPMSQTIEFLINQEDLPNLSQGTEKIPRQQTSIFQGRSNATANFIPAPVGTIDGSYAMLSNGQISIAEGRSPNRKSQMSLSTYLAKYMVQLQSEDPRWISFELDYEDQIFQNNSLDQTEEDNYFEASELDVLYNCHRTITTPLGSTKKYYQVQILKCIFKGKRVLTCILKDITDKQTSRYNRFIELSKDRLLQSLARDIKSPLIKLASCFESLNTFDDPLKSENGILLSSQVLSKKKSLESAQQYLLQANYQTSDVVDLLSVINGTLELNKKFFLVHSLVSDLSKIYQNELKDRKITLEINCLVDPSERIFSDFQRLKQVLVNLLSLSLQYVVEGTVSLSLSFYDTKKETIEIVLVLKDSVLPTHILKQLSKSFSQFDQKFEQLQSGKTLQLLLCSALIDRIGPTQAFSVSQDERNAEIRFKIFSNLMNDSRQFESRTQFISFNRENGYLGDSFFPKKQLVSSNSNVLTKKNLRGFSNQLIDITLSETSSPQKIAARAFQYFQPIKITQLQSFQQIIASPPKGQISQEDKVIFESACLLTEEIMEKQQAETDQAASKIPRDGSSANKQKTMIDTIYNNNQNLGGGTTPKIRSTAETFEIDLVEDIRRFVGNSKILLIDPDQGNFINLQNLLVKIQSIEVENAPDCRRALRKIIESDSNPYEQKPYRLIILNISTSKKEQLENVKQEGQSNDIDIAGQPSKEENKLEQQTLQQDSKEHEQEEEKTYSVLLEEFKKIQKYMKNVLQVSPIPLIITFSPQQQEECQQCCEEVGALGSLQLPLTLECFTRALSKQIR